MRQGKYPQSLVAVLTRQFSVKRGPADAQRFCGLRHVSFGLGNGFVDHGELELLQLIAKGSSYVNCAEVMGISLATVQTHIRNMYRKLEVNNQRQAIVKAQSSGLLSF
jgi:ATP/maltotriose-dependent transcriptional regulator MalT